MTKGIVGGGQKRTIVCSCGYRIIGNPKRLDTATRLHNKVCPDAKINGSKDIMPSSVPFDNVGNTAMSGFSKTRHGNMRLDNKIVSKNMIDGAFVSHTTHTRAEVKNDDAMAAHMMGLKLGCELDN